MTGEEAEEQEKNLLLKKGAREGLSHLREVGLVVRKAEMTAVTDAVSSQKSGRQRSGSQVWELSVNRRGKGESRVQGNSLGVNGGD